MKVELCKYLGGARGAFSFTFDDGCYRESSEEVLENFKRVYNEYGVKLKSTVGITVGFMHEWIIRFWQNAVSEGYFEIGSHSVGHDLAYLESTPLEVREGDAKNSQIELRKMFPGQAVDTYILPGGTYDAGGLLPLKDYYIAVRCNKDGINYYEDVDFLDIKCFTAMLKRPFSDYKDYIDEVIKTGGWGVQMNHWITHKKEDTFHSQSADSFYDECTYLGKKAKGGELWVAPFGEVAGYMLRYKESELKITEENGIYTIEIAGNGKDKTDTPMTILIETDKKISVVNNGNNETILEPRNGKIYLNISDFVKISELN